MDREEGKMVSEIEEKIFQIYTDFLTRVTKFEELGAVGGGLLRGFLQGLEFLQRPPINKTSVLVENIIKANETKRVKSYVEAGCINTHDSIQNISKCRCNCHSEVHTCQLGLRDHLSKAKCIHDELKCLVDDAAVAMQTVNESLSHLWDKDFGNGLDQQATYDKEEMSSHVQKPEVTDYVVTMGIIYSMVKQDYMMQERIVTSLNLKSSSGELESYCMMCSLRPFINEEIMHQAWKLIPS